MVPRRLRLLVIAALAFTISMLIYTSRLRENYTPDPRTIQDFYHKTKGALAGSAGSNTGPPKPVDLDNDGDIDEDDMRLAAEMQNRLKAAEQQAKDQANAKSPNRPDAPSDVIGVGSASGARVVAADAADAPAAAAAAPAAEPISDENKAVDAELDAIVKKSPVVIFSKSYCPFSKRAKGLLLDKYVIEPPPFVVELDTHPMGPALQARLGELTGRRTVPNILVGGKSIGGGDDVAEMDGNKLLVDKILTLSSKRVTMKERLV